MTIALRAVVQTRTRYYNRERRHSSLGNRPPRAFIEDLYREG
ncbi:MAG: integrase core domain-containing protein [Gemmatimonadota bacterium]